MKVYIPLHQIDAILPLFLKGGGHGKTKADFFGQIFSLGSGKTENISY